MTALIRAVHLLATRNQSIYRLCRELGVSKRTVHRYIRNLKLIGIEVKKKGTGVYGLDKCPFCNHDL